MDASSFVARLHLLPQPARLAVESAGMCCDSDVAGLTKDEWLSIPPAGVAPECVQAFERFWHDSVSGFDRALSYQDTPLRHVAPLHAPHQGHPATSIQSAKALPLSRKRPRCTVASAGVVDNHKAQWIGRVVEVM